MGVGHVLPLEVLEKCLGRKVWLLMKGEREFFGTLLGFDEGNNMAMILKQAKEYTYAGAGAERSLVNQAETILLNGTHITMVVPGSDEPRPRAVNE